jgi:hypothetical protein
MSSVEKKLIEFDYLLGEMKEYCKKTPPDISLIVGVLRTISNVINDPMAGKKQQDLAKKAYTKAINRVPTCICDAVMKELLIEQPVDLDQNIIEQIFIESKQLLKIKPLVIALFQFLSGSKHQEHSHCFRCDNKERPAVGYPAIMRLVHELQSGKKAWDKDLEQLFQRVRNCKNRNSCSGCRALHVMFLMLRDPSNDQILYNVCRSVYDKSDFAGQVLVSFLRLPTVLGPDSVLASVIESSPSGPMSVYVPSLIESLTSMSHVETPDEERARIKYDEQTNALNFSFFMKHEQTLYSSFMLHSSFLKEKGIEEKVKTTVEECMNPRTIEARRLQLISLLRLYVEILRNPRVAIIDTDEMVPLASRTVMSERSVEITQKFQKYLDKIPQELLVEIDSFPDSSHVKQEQCVCSVCLDGVADSVLNCGHKLCAGCARTILSSTHACPNCRASITEVVCTELIGLGGICGHCDFSKQSPATHCHIACGHRICCDDCAKQQGNSEKKCPSCSVASRVIKVFDST